MSSPASSTRSRLSRSSTPPSPKREPVQRNFATASFLPNLKKALEIPTRLTMSARGLMGVHANFKRFLVNRLRWEADVEKHPQILEEDVSDPIVILGLPRSGTTKLQRFLSADPNVQATPAWAMFNPAPFPGETPGDPCTAHCLGQCHDGRGHEHRRDLSDHA